MSLTPRPVAAFDSHQCLVVPDDTVSYVLLTVYHQSFEQELSQYAQVTPIYVDTESSMPDPRFTVFRATPYTDVGQPVASFGDALDVNLMQPIDEVQAPPGAVIPIVLGIQPLHQLGFLPSVFIHLYGDPSPYEGGARSERRRIARYARHIPHNCGAPRRL